MEDKSSWQTSSVKILSYSILHTNSSLPSDMIDMACNDIYKLAGEDSL